MELVKSGVTQSEIQRLIVSAPSVDFLLTPAATDQLMKAGVSDDTIKIMAARESGAAPAAQSTVTPAIGGPSAANVLPESATSPIGKSAGFGSRTDVFGGYSYLSLDVPDTDRVSFNGWEASVTPLADHRIAPEISGSGYYKSSGFGSASAYAFLGGPRIRFGQAYFHALGGVDVIRASAFGFSDSETAFAAAFGGGAQSKPFGGHFAIRFGADYVLTTHDAGAGESPIQNHFRVTSGIVYVFGSRNENR
jgi:hypothetical protein